MNKMHFTHILCSVLSVILTFLAFPMVLNAAFFPEPVSTSRVPADNKEIYRDWLLQDLAWSSELGQQLVTPESEIHTIFTPNSPGTEKAERERVLVQKVLAEILERDAMVAECFQGELTALDGVPGTDARWQELYRRAASARRALRLSSAHKMVPRMVFTKHHNLGGSHYAYTDALSDAQAERTFSPNSQLCLLELTPEGEYRETILISDPCGVIRDPEISWDGKSVIFAWKKSDRLDDFHIYRMDLATKKVTQLTFGLGWADYEPCELPGGDIIFNSTRCSQVVDCWWTEVANLYRMDAEGRFMRRMTFDQVHDNYPTWTHDGRIIYTRWDYNDRGQIFPQGLFQMNPDGTGQTALYGNNSWFPTTILHTRSIPNTNGKLLCVFSGHHTWQRGKLGVLDPNKGREENEGATLAAPFRHTEPVHVDAYGQEGEQFCYPMPVTEKEFFVAYRPNEDLPNKNAKQGALSPFSIYYMDLDGRRELIVRDPVHSCNQTAFRTEYQEEGGRVIAQERPSHVQPEEETGIFYLQDVFYGPGLAGVARDSIRSLRVVELGFRNVGIGSNSNGGPAGGAMVSTPISIGGGTWDTKKVLGEAKIYEDGSACFRVPARTPLYFQVIDKNGHVVQTMRSWSTLQPGETFSCIGCHEDKNSIAARGSSSLAMKAGPQELTPFYGPTRWFSYEKEIQPILDKHCIGCHDNPNAKPPFENRRPTQTQLNAHMVKPIMPIFSTWSTLMENTAEKLPANWTTTYPLVADSLRPAPFGDVKNLPLSIPTDAEGREIRTDWRTKNIWTTTELVLPENYEKKDLYLQIFYDEDTEVYINGEEVFNAKGFVRYYLVKRLAKNPLRPGRNIIAVHCLHREGGRGLDVGLYERNDVPTHIAIAKALANPENAGTETEEFPGNITEHPFSLTGRLREDVDAKRFWSESYLNLTNSIFNKRASGRKSDVVNWINIQNSPVMLAPYDSGAAQSRISYMFDGANPHHGIRLSQEEKDKISCWIDLLVPFCDTYETATAWNDADRARYAHYMAKKHTADARDAVNYAAWAKMMKESESGTEIDAEVCGKLGAETVTDTGNQYRNLVPEMEQEEKPAEKPEWKMLRYACDTPIKADQIRVEIAEGAGNNVQEVQIQIGAHTERVTLSNENRSGTFRFPTQTVLEVKVTTSVPLARTEIYGIQMDTP
ncbi:MAG: hypothetical protein Q4C70_12615 [Planctomycetia bacterium]|nr:hypothetical protein [Planctomycetia bacterium]